MDWRNFALAPLAKLTTASVLLIGGGIPLGMAVLIALRAQEDGLGPLGALASLFLSMLIVCVILLPLLRRQVAFDGRSIRVRAAWFARTAAVSEFDLGQARIVDLRERTELRPWLKTFGFSLPGLRAGHYRSRDRRKVFCLVSDPSKVLLLPHADGGLWLLSFRNPQAVLDVLRSARG